MYRILVVCCKIMELLKWLPLLIKVTAEGVCEGWGWGQVWRDGAGMGNDNRGGGGGVMKKGVEVDHRNQVYRCIVMTVTTTGRPSFVSFYRELHVQHG